MKKNFIAAFLTVIALFTFTVPSAPLLSAAAPEFEKDYTLLDWEPMGNCYWMSTEPNLYHCCDII